MNYNERRKIGKRFLVAIVSILACVAVMAVGVYAASANFSVTVENEINIQISKVDGVLYGKRGGDVIYGTTSMGSGANNFTESLYASTDLLDEADANGYLYLYGNEEGSGYVQNEQNMEEIQKQVNFFTYDAEYLTMYYVFKFEFAEESPTNISIKLTNNTNRSSISDLAEGSVVETYKYVQGNRALAEPDWATAGTTMTFVNNVNEITVVGNNEDTHVVYIYASLTVKRTNSLASAFVIGEKYNKPYSWAFSLVFTATTAQN